MHCVIVYRYAISALKNKYTYGSSAHLTVNYQVQQTGAQKRGPALSLIFGYRLISCIEKNMSANFSGTVY